MKVKVKYYIMNNEPEDFINDIGYENVLNILTNTYSSDLIYYTVIY